MDVSQIINLSVWFEEYSDEFIEKYNMLLGVLNHNAQQASSQPVTEPLQVLIETLENLPLSKLTNEELDKLESLGVLQYLGGMGINFINQTITMGAYDPATAAQNVQRASQKLTQHKQYFKTLDKALAQLDFEEFYDEEVVGQTMVRVRFKEGAAITDVTQLKKWAIDWLDITRGAARCAGETPESVKVVGANNGSVIIVFGTIASIQW